MTRADPLRVLVVTSGWPSPERPETSVFVDQEVRFLQERGVDVEVVTYDGRQNPLNYLRARRRVRRELHRRRYDIVHGHFGQSGLVVLGAGVPVVITFHGSDLLGVIGRRGKNTLRGRLLRLISRSVARRADKVIVAGRKLVAELPSGIQYDLVPAGVDPSVFKPGPRDAARAELGLPNAGRLVLFSGSPSVPRKRYPLAVEAVGLLRSHMDVELLTVGGVPRETVARYMQACNALLVTSTHESGPAMVKEALACNLRVVSLDVGDVRERIGNLPGSLLCDDDRADTVAAGLLQSLSYEGPFDGRVAVTDVLQDRLTERLVGIYSELAG